MALNNSAGMLRELGQFERATERYEEAIAIWEGLGGLWGVAMATGGLADVALDQRDTQRAIDGYCKALAISVDLDDKITVAYCLGGLSCTEALAGDFRRAGTLWAAAGLIEDTSGSQLHAIERERYERLLSEAQDEPAFVTAFEEAAN